MIVVRWKGIYKGNAIALSTILVELLKPYIFIQNFCTHHKVVFAELYPNFEYLWLYDSLIWDYKNAKVQPKNSVIQNFDCVN